MTSFEVGDRVQSIIHGFTGEAVEIVTEDTFYVKADDTGGTILFEQRLFELEDVPMPKLKKLMERPSPFAETEEDKLIAQVDKFVADYREFYVDEEEAHGSEDEIYKKALRLIATGESRDPAKLSAKVLELEPLDFPRWYA